MLISRITHWPIDGYRDHAACGILVLDSWKRLGRSFVESNAAVRQPKHSAAMLNLCLLYETE